MGKAIDVGKAERDNRQKIAAPDAVVCECCTPVDAFAIKPKVDLEPNKQPNTCEQKEIVIIGAGPHALTLVLRLLEPEADLSSDKERHIKADYENRMRPFSRVREHIKNLTKGPSAVYKRNSARSKKKANDSRENENPAPLTLDYFKENVLVVDGSLSESEEGRTNDMHGWMAGWKKNFETLNIDQLRSPISAHADPYDHRSLSFFGTHAGRDNELIPLEHLSKQTGRWDFHGPYSAPSTDIFHDFHDLLITGYGVQGMVQSGRVETIRCDANDGQFELSIVDPGSGQAKLVKTPRVVCAVGPTHRRVEPLLSQMAQLAPRQIPHRILQQNQIIDFLAKQKASTELPLVEQSILIVGGGVTSAHLALTAADACKCPWCQSVMLIQRSKQKERQFDLDSVWMGPGRGRRLDNFWSHSTRDRASVLRDERGGGSIHPEVARLLKKATGPHGKLSMQEQTEIMEVQYDFQQDKLLVSLDDGLPPKAFDMIWLATGFENQLQNYPLLAGLGKELPVDVVEGLPILNKDLSWKKSEGAAEEEPDWKVNARNRLWIMGPLAGLELGPDALNLMGARHGAVRVAKALRADICANRQVRLGTRG